MRFATYSFVISKLHYCCVNYIFVLDKRNTAVRPAAADFPRDDCLTVSRNHAVFVLYIIVHMLRYWIYIYIYVCVCVMITFSIEKVSLIGQLNWHNLFRVWREGRGERGVRCASYLGQKSIVPWACYQIRKIAGCACAENARNLHPATDYTGNR